MCVCCCAQLLVRKEKKKIFVNVFGKLGVVDHVPLFQMTY